MKRLIIIPTYNERENITKMIHTVMALELDFDLLIVDDGSPDGTASLVREAQECYGERLHLLERRGKLGLGTAYIAGFKLALERDYDRIFEAVERQKRVFEPKNELQEKFGRVFVISDGAHAFGAMREGKMCGEIADFTNFSFHAVKNMTTAEGGAAVHRSHEAIDEDWMYKQYMLLSLHGQTKDALSKTKLGAWEYDVIGPWYKCNMTDVAAAMGLSQMKRYDEMLRRREEIIGRYDAAFKPLGVKVLDHYNEVHHSSGHLYITRIPGITDQQRNEIIVKMAELGVACNVHYKPLPMHTAYKNLGFDIANYPNAYAHFANEITLPLHTNLTDEQVQYVIDNYTEVLKPYV